MLALGLAACSSLPAIGGRPLLPSIGPAGPVVYRNLADIPGPPPVTPPEVNEATIQTLTMDRARTAQAAEDLRRQQVTIPAPAPPLPPGF